MRGNHSPSTSRQGNMKTLVFYILVTVFLSVEATEYNYTYDYQDYDTDYAGIAESNHENYSDGANNGELKIFSLKLKKKKTKHRIFFVEKWLRRSWTGVRHMRHVWGEIRYGRLLGRPVLFASDELTQLP
jgi:hypothetical protein